MKKQDLFKRAAVLALAGTLVTGNAMPSFAAGWQWLDENNDGISELYYLDDDGHKLTGTAIPGGYTVNEDGAWVSGGQVMTKGYVAPGPTDAAEWHHDGTGWRYRKPNGYDASREWVWHDWDGDGTAELYYLDVNGYLLVGGGVSDNGHTVNGDGARVENGVVLTQPATPVYAPENTYNAQGVSNIALEMVDNTREENVKFGEVIVYESGTQHLRITYANGFVMEYDASNSDRTLSASGKGNDKLLFRYYDSSFTSAEEIADYLHGKGFKDGYGGTYANGSTCRIGLGDGHPMMWHESMGVGLGRK